MTFATHLAPCHACRCPAYLSVRVASRPNLGVFTPVTPEWHRLLHAAATHDTVARRSTLVARSETMKLQGSCHCGKVKFTFETKTPQPFMHCYCSICRKTQGGSGSCINIMVERKTLMQINDPVNCMTSGHTNGSVFSLLPRACHPSPAVF